MQGRQTPVRATLASQLSHSNPTTGLHGVRSCGWRDRKPVAKVQGVSLSFEFLSFPSVLFLVHFHVYVSIMCTHVYVCAHICVWGPEDNLRCLSSGTTHLAFCLSWVFYWSGAHLSDTLMDYRVPKDPLVSAFPELGWQVCATKLLEIFFYLKTILSWVVGIELRSSCLQGENFID